VKAAVVKAAEGPKKQEEPKKQEIRENSNGI